MSSHTNGLLSFNGDAHACKLDPQNSCARAVHIFDVKGKEQKNSFVKELFQPFAFPQPTTETRTCELYQPDGSKKTRRLPKNLRRLPTEILYDAKGLELFERITELEDEYYLTRCEREILHTKMPEIVKYISDGASIVELGCGSMSKTATFLDHVRKAGRRDVKFFALDIERSFLQTSLTELAKEQEKQDDPEENRIEFAGIYGSYTDALSSFLRDVSGQKVLLWLGSSIGNFIRSDACALVRRFQTEAMNEGDVFFIGVDKRKDPATVARAYNDAGGVAAEFGLNGLDHVRRMGIADLDRERFDCFSGYNDIEGRNEAYYRSLASHTICVPGPDGVCEKVNIEKDELIRFGFSVKYSKEELQELASNTGLLLENIWTDAQDMYNFCMFRKPFSQSAE